MIAPGPGANLLVAGLLVIAVVLGTARMAWQLWRQEPTARPRAWRTALLLLLQAASAALLYCVLMPPPVAGEARTLVVLTARSDAVPDAGPEAGRAIVLPETLDGANLVNAERARYGLGAVTYESRLDLAAERHASQMGAVAVMAHDGIGDADPGARARAAGWHRSWGENVAVGQTTPEQVMAEWMASPGHRRNILDPAFTRLGVSYTTGVDRRPYWAQAFGA